MSTRIMLRSTFMGPLVWLWCVLPLCSGFTNFQFKNQFSVWIGGTSANNYKNRHRCCGRFVGPIRSSNLLADEVPISRDLDSRTKIGKNMSAVDAKKYFLFLNETYVLPERNGAEKWIKFLDEIVKFKRIHLVIIVVDRILDLNIRLTTYHWLGVLSLLCGSGYFTDGLRIFDRGISSGGDLTVHMFSPLLKASGNSKNARDLFRRMEFFGFSPNVISFTTAIKSCELTGDWQSALELLDLMRMLGVEPNEITYCCVISVASKAMAGNVAINILREMAMNNVPPNILCFGSALSACARSRMWNEVDILLYDMEKYGIELTESVLISIIVACRSGPVDEMLNLATADSSPMTESLSATPGHDSPSTYRKFEVDPSTVNWRKAISLVKEWAPRIKTISESVFTMAMDVCESAGQYNEIISLYWLMAQTKVKPGKNACRFALRSCYIARDAENAVKILENSDSRGAVRPYMYNNTIMMCEETGRFDLCLRLLRLGQEKNIYNPPVAITKRLLWSAFDYFNDLQGNTTSLASPPDLDRILLNLGAVIRYAVLEQNISVQPQYHTLALKILLAQKDFSTIRGIIARSHHQNSFNSQTDCIDRYFEPLVKQIAESAPQEVAIEALLYVIKDAYDLGKHRLAVELMTYSILQLVSVSRRADLAMGHSAEERHRERHDLDKFIMPLDLSSNSTESDTNRVQAENSYSNNSKRPTMNETQRTITVEAICEFFRSARLAVNKRGIPARTYLLIGLLCQEAGLSSFMIDLYTFAVEDGTVEPPLQEAFNKTLSKREAQLHEALRDISTDGGSHSVG